MEAHTWHDWSRTRVSYPCLSRLEKLQILLWSCAWSGGPLLHFTLGRELFTLPCDSVILDLLCFSLILMYNLIRRLTLAEFLPITSHCPKEVPAHSTSDNPIRWLLFLFPLYSCNPGDLEALSTLLKVPHLGQDGNLDSLIMKRFWIRNQ